ncbi:hypothetical protein K461DRAFT_52165 [Myriangium duriaei CBS 260.36]|uniref:Uncharacterized protein n=1 Tax=Myriangium duriaei CBS 260.36 TaxID=1168546 RepID=A0A9P4IVR0_9PEZI|nr:hypothetical protein K461DRAFT_52165 [Myriangium duriaei CBS 260.36]
MGLRTRSPTKLDHLTSRLRWKGPFPVNIADHGLFSFNPLPFHGILHCIGGRGGIEAREFSSGAEPRPTSRATPLAPTAKESFSGARTSPKHSGTIQALPRCDGDLNCRRRRCAVGTGGPWRRRQRCGICRAKTLLAAWGDHLWQGWRYWAECKAGLFGGSPMADRQAGRQCLSLASALWRQMLYSFCRPSHRAGNLDRFPAWRSLGGWEGVGVRDGG